MSAPASASSSPSVGEAHALAQLGAQRRRGRRARAALTTVASHGSVGVQAAQRAQEEPQRAALLDVDERDPHAARRPRAGRARGGVPVPGRDELVVAGKKRFSSSAVAPNAAWRASRRPKTSVTSLRATCVATTRSAGAWNVPTFSAREWRSATRGDRRRERLVDVADVQRRARSAAPRPCARRRSARRAGARPCRAGRPAAPRRRPARAPRRARRARRRRGSRARAARDRLLVARRRRDDDAMPAAGELLAQPGDVGVDLVPVLPRIGRDLDDGSGSTGSA